MALKKKAKKIKRISTNSNGDFSAPPKPEVKEQMITSISSYVNYVKNHCTQERILFRGQRRDLPLLPRIARIMSKFKMLELEKRMFNEFKRQAIPYLEFEPKTKWDWLAIAQHFGMSTRLLDWTLNPLAALWFAVAKPPFKKNEQSHPENGVVWIFTPTLDSLKPPTGSPFNPDRTTVFQPNHITRRIVAQSGWFTVHKYLERRSKFIPLERLLVNRMYLTKLIIPPDQFAEMRRQLDRFGINAATLFPDLDGICRSIEWAHSLLEDEKEETPKRLFRKVKKLKRAKKI